MTGVPQLYDAGKGLLRWWLDREQRSLKVHRIVDPQDDDLEPALDLCQRLLPPNEVDSPAQVAAWLGEIRQEIAEGRSRLVDYLLVAKVGRQICGVLYAHYYPGYQLMFVSYVVADDQVAEARDGRAAQCLLNFLNKFRDDELKDMEGIVFEMEFPASEDKEQALRNRSRRRLFEFYAKRLGITARVLDIPYLQPRLDLADSAYTEERQLLAYGRTQGPAISGSIPREEISKVLTFVYSAIYGDQFEGDPQQDREYREYLDGLRRSITEQLPVDVPVTRAHT